MPLVHLLLHVHIHFTSGVFVKCENERKCSYKANPAKFKFVSKLTTFVAFLSRMKSFSKIRETEEQSVAKK